MSWRKDDNVLVTDGGRDRAARIILSNKNGSYNVLYSDNEEEEDGVVNSRIKKMEKRGINWCLICCCLVALLLLAGLGYFLWKYLHKSLGCDDGDPVCTVEQGLNYVQFNGQEGAPLFKLHAYNCQLCWLDATTNPEDQIEDIQSTNGTSCASPSASDQLPCDCQKATDCVYVYCTTDFGPRYAPLESTICSGTSTMTMSIRGPQWTADMNQYDYIIVAGGSGSSAPTPPPGPTPPPTRVPEGSVTSEQVVAGTRQISVVDQSPYSVGDLVEISSAGFNDTCGVVGFGSLICDRAIQNNYPKLSSVSIVRKYNGTAPDWLLAYQQQHGTTTAQATATATSRSVTTTSAAPSSTTATTAPSTTSTTACVDTANYTDEKGYQCSEWLGYAMTCVEAHEVWNYTQAGEDDLIANCRPSCGMCPNKADNVGAPAPAAGSITTHQPTASPTSVPAVTARRLSQRPENTRTIV